MPAMTHRLRRWLLRRDPGPRGCQEREVRARWGALQAAPSNFSHFLHDVSSSYSSSRGPLADWGLRAYHLAPFSFSYVKGESLNAEQSIKIRTHTKSTKCC